MKKRITLLLLTLCLQLSADESWNDMFAKGMTYAYEGKFQESYNFFDKCVQNRKEKDFFYYDSVLQKNISALSLGYEKEAKEGCEYILKECPFDQIKYEASLLKSHFFGPSQLRERKCSRGVSLGRLQMIDEIR